MCVYVFGGFEVGEGEEFVLGLEWGGGMMMGWGEVFCGV